MWLKLALDCPALPCHSNSPYHNAIFDTIANNIDDVNFQDVKVQALVVNGTRSSLDDVMSRSLEVLSYDLFSFSTLLIL